MNSNYKTYEITIILRAGCNAKEETKDIENTIKELDGKIIFKEAEGIKYMPYKLQGDARGDYYYYEAELGDVVPQKLSSRLNIRDNVLRYLVVRQDERHKLTRRQ